MQIPISRPENMALKEEKSSRSVLPGHLATGDTKKVHRPPTIRMDNGRQQPATNYQRTESIINVPVQRDNLVPKDPGIVSQEERHQSFDRANFLYLMVFPRYIRGQMIKSYFGL